MQLEMERMRLEGGKNRFGGEGGKANQTGCLRSSKKS